MPGTRRTSAAGAAGDATFGLEKLTLANGGKKDDELAAENAQSESLFFLVSFLFLNGHLTPWRLGFVS